MFELLVMLAVWRITAMLETERGPYALFERLRKSLKGEAKTLFGCFYCLSVWVALPFSLLFPYWFIHWLALSTGAIFLETLRLRLDN